MELSTGADLTGSQAIRRALSILQLVARHPFPGPALGEVAEGVGLKRSTTHRFLRYFVAQRMLEYDQDSHCYSVGLLLFELGLLKPLDYHDVIPDTTLKRIANSTGQTSYILARSGAESVCVQMADGHAQVRVTPVDVGQRRPLGVGAGGIALLSAFEVAEIEDYVRSIGPALKPFPNITPDTMMSDVLDAKQRGYAISMGRVYSEVVGIGLLLPSEPRPWLAVSITVPTSYLQRLSTDELAQLMRQEIANQGKH